MSLRLQIWIYLAVLHAAMLLLLVWQRESLGWWLLPLEAALVVTFLLGARLVHVAFRPVRAAFSLADSIKSGEFASRYAPVGHKEIDSILEAYNLMLANLQREWLRLGEQRGFLERFLHITPIGVMIFDFEQRLSVANRRARELLGVDAELELTGLDLGTLPSPLAGVLAQLDGDTTRMITDPAGRRLRCRRGEFQDRGFTRSYVLIEELTAELNRTERETYEKLIRMVSHEVTNTVAATNSLLESCLRYAVQLHREEDRQDYVNALQVLIARNCNLNEFIGRFSELVRLPEPNRQHIQLRELLFAMGTMFKAELEQRRIVLEVRAAEDLPRVSMDRNQMDRVMINVMKNAIEAVDQDGRIQLLVTRDAQGVQLAVIDDGIGLSSDSKDSLFVPFYTTKRHGQGLGLTLVKEILVQHGFAFSLESRNGETAFRILMPV